ncbi:hypothetical protein HY251_08065 [bacterium]|nr:hypothetical protein [bacterium]
MLVARAPPGEETASSGYTLAYRKTVKESDRKFPGDAVLLRVAPLSKTTPRHVLVATLGPTHLEIELMPLEGSVKIGPAPGGPPASLLLPPPRNAKPRE